ncbi:TspO/MBR family protein [Thioalkalivibrio sp. XN279]|uniref:TspO/MBR family protein n=1 Tax=Thioalkalivibrio sp. XN279 TaxID=2714953 RepID=UPI00351AC846
MNPTTSRSPAVQALGLAFWLVLAYITAAIGAIASVNAPEFYGQLIQPTWGPPAWVFGPVWTTLFTMMGIAAWLVWRAAPLEATRGTLGLFVVHLAVNALWSWLFFAWNLGFWAFVEVLLLWVLILATILAFWRFSRVAALLLVPYLGWVSFAAALNFWLWRENAGLLG